MKIFCHVNGKQAVVVGYGPGRKGRPRAIIISGGVLRDVALKDIVLDKEMATLGDGQPTQLRRAK